ncbi:hypothetical protein Hanom_Chr10g00900671 [Helianthus anomalus]
MCDTYNTCCYTCFSSPSLLLPIYRFPQKNSSSSSRFRIFIQLIRTKRPIGTTSLEVVV